MPCQHAPGTGSPSVGTQVPNWAQNVVAFPQYVYTPTSLDQLVAIVKEAEAQNAAVRAFGSGWSFTDIMDTPDFLVKTDLLNGTPWPSGAPHPGSLPTLVPLHVDNTLCETMTGTAYPDDPVYNALTPLARNKKLCHLQAGIKIHDLYLWLESIPGGVVTGDGHSHGYAVPTLGGSGGQSLAGAISTSVHGGDDHNDNGPIPPLPDMVQAIHLVGAGGAEFFIQRGGINAIVDTALLGELMPCVAGPGQIISDDDVFNSAVVSMGRMGIIYALVIEVRPQYFLQQTITKTTWSSALANLATLRPANRFLQVFILPYADSNGDHTCFVTTRNEIDPANYMDSAASPPDTNLFNVICDANPDVINATVGAFLATLIPATVTLDAVINAILWAASAVIPGISGLAQLVALVLGVTLSSADIAIIAALSPLLKPGVTIGQALATSVNFLTSHGMIGVAEQITNAILSSQMSAGTKQNISYKIMDTYDYNSKCYKALSIEVAFNADDSAFANYVQAVFGLIDGFASQNILAGAYISLRFCGGSNALLAIEQWTHTVCIEIAALAGLAHDEQVLTALMDEAANHVGSNGSRATVHWGQLNDLTVADVEATFPGKIDRWRSALARLSAKGRLGTFDNDYCATRGLEVLGTTIKRDLSYLAPLLLETSGATHKRDLSYLIPLLHS